MLCVQEQQTKCAMLMLSVMLMTARVLGQVSGFPLSPYGGSGGASLYGGAGHYGATPSLYGVGHYGGSGGLGTYGVPSYQSLTSGGTYYRQGGGGYVAAKSTGAGGIYSQGNYQQNVLRQIANPYNGYGATTYNGAYNGGYGNFYGGTRYNGISNGVQYGYGGAPAFQPKLEVSLTGPGGFPVHNSQVSAVAQYGLPGTPFGGQLYNNQLFGSAGLPGYSPSFATQNAGSQYLYPGGVFGANRQQQNSVSFSNFG
jgi:hypothetical protein